MTTTFPGSLDTFTNPNAAGGDTLASVPHDSQHANINDAVTAIEAKLGIDSSAVATSIDYKLKNTSSVSPGHKHNAADIIPTAPAALTFSGTVTWDLNAAPTATLAATSNIPFTLSNPTNMTAGATYILTITQFSTGGQVITWGSAYKFAGGSKFVLSTANNAIDIITFYSDGTSMYAVGQGNFS